MKWLNNNTPSWHTCSQTIYQQFLSVCPSSQIPAQYFSTFHTAYEREETVSQTCIHLRHYIFDCVFLFEGIYHISFPFEVRCLMKSTIMVFMVKVLKIESRPESQFLHFRYADLCFVFDTPTKIWPSAPTVYVMVITMSLLLFGLVCQIGFVKKSINFSLSIFSLLKKNSDWKFFFIFGCVWWIKLFKEFISKNIVNIINVYMNVSKKFQIIEIVDENVLLVL